MFYAKFGQRLLSISLQRIIFRVINEVRGHPLFSPQDGENVYRLLGAYPSVSEAMGDYVASTDAIHWSQWKEEKF
jgi:hypothetical protein